jgi:guanosine-3',5'-bis(diphosphate) 3'-pyrophosphohydrolase
MTSLEKTYRPLLDAVAFAARAHAGQLRKDGKTPYASHVFRVCLVLRHIFGIDDQDTLTAALLHDTVEDTTTDFDDIAECWDVEVADWVAALSKDKRVRDDDREARYAAALAAAPWQVKVCKLADVFDNLMDSSTQLQRSDRTFRRSRFYLDALKQNLPKEAERPWQMVADLLAELQTAQEV